MGMFQRGLRAVATVLDWPLTAANSFQRQVHTCIYCFTFFLPFFVLWFSFQPSGNILYKLLLCYKSPFQFN